MDWSRTTSFAGTRARGKSVVEGLRKQDSLRSLEESFKPWKSGLFGRGLAEVQLGGAEVPAEGGQRKFVMTLISETFSALLGQLGIGIGKADRWDGTGFC